MLRMLIELE